MGERAGPMSDEQDVQELRGDIAGTRQDMSRTIDQLEEKLSINNLQAQLTESLHQLTDQILSDFQEKTVDLTGKLNTQIETALHSAASSKVDQLLEQVGSRATSAGGSLWHRLSQNPVPISLAALGIGLVAADGQQVRSVVAGQEDKGIGESVKETVDGQVAGLREGLSSVADRVHSMGSSSDNEGSAAREGSNDGVAKLRGAVGDQALIPGLLALGIGIVAGLGLPETGPERATAGSVRDRILDGLDQTHITGSSGSGQGLVDQVKSGASALVNTATEATKAAATEVRHSAAEMRSDIADSVKQSTDSTRGN